MKRLRYRLEYGLVRLTMGLARRCAVAHDARDGRRASDGSFYALDRRHRRIALGQRRGGVSAPLRRPSSAPSCGACSAISGGCCSS